MNPVNRFNFDNFKEIVDEIENLGQHEHLPLLEDKVIQEIVTLVCEGTEEAKAKLKRLEKLLHEEIKITHKSHRRLQTLKNSISGALSVAKFCLF